MSYAQSKQLAAPWRLGVPPYLRCGKWTIGWCSEGGIGTGDNGKNISSSSPMLSDGWRALRCGLHIRTAAATACQRGYRGVQGEEEALRPRRRGLWQHHFSQADGADRQAAGSGETARCPGSKQRTVSARLRFRVGSVSSVGAAGQGVAPALDGRSMYVWSAASLRLSAYWITSILIV